MCSGAFRNPMCSDAADYHPLSAQSPESDEAVKRTNVSCSAADPLSAPGRISHAFIFYMMNRTRCTLAVALKLTTAAAAATSPGEHAEQLSLRTTPSNATRRCARCWRSTAASNARLHVHVCVADRGSRAREKHNATEQKRAKRVRDGFASLSEVLQVCSRVRAFQCGVCSVCRVCCVCCVCCVCNDVGMVL
jgi:hypothetical protein